MDMIDGAIDDSHVGGEGRQLIDDFAELEERETIDGAQDGVSEAARRFHFQLLIAARTEAGVDGHHD